MQQFLNLKLISFQMILNFLGSRYGIYGDGILSLWWEFNRRIVEYWSHSVSRVIELFGLS